MSMYPPLVVSLEEGSYSPSQSSFRKPVDMVEGKPVVRLENASETKSASNEKKVSFGKRVKIKKIRSHKLYTQAERDAIWLNEEEMLNIKRGCIRTLREMMKFNFKENDEFCPRGLEVRTKEASIARKETRVIAAQIILEEQELQMDWGVKDDERLRESYLDISQEAHSRAHFRGLSDEKIARDYQRSARRRWQV